MFSSCPQPLPLTRDIDHGAVFGSQCAHMRTVIGVAPSFQRQFIVQGPEWRSAVARYAEEHGELVTFVARSRVIGGGTHLNTGCFTACALREVKNWAGKEFLQWRTH